jgi:hypothetical protein
MDFNLEHRKYVVLNIPAIVLLLIGEIKDADQETIEVFRKHVVTKYDALTKDTDEEVRMYCASIY